VATLSAGYADGYLRHLSNRDAAVLVHGSGPNDRDESVGANKIFKDIAEGLATAGVAVLRYDKRTYTYGDQLTNDLTLDDEVITDAVAAVHVLQARPDIARVIVVGHSLGGMLAPEIAARAGHVAAVAMLAPPARPPLVILRDQLRYLGAPRELRGQVEAALAVVELAALGDDPSLQVLGMPLSYWRDWEAHDGVAAARALEVPLLVLQGERDYQVTREDFGIWKRTLGHRAAYALLSGDNHGFFRGRGRPSPHDYAEEAHVDPRVVDRLVELVRRPDVARGLRSRRCVARCS